MQRSQSCGVRWPGLAVTPCVLLLLVAASVRTHAGPPPAPSARLAATPPVQAPPGALARFRAWVLSWFVRPPSATDEERARYLTITARNEKVMEILAPYLENRKADTIAILYGAGHMDDFDERLRQLGYRPVKKEWLTAWAL